MKKITLSFLQGFIVLLGIVVFVLMLWEPHLEGRNVGATLFEIYFNDPFLAYVYAASTLFFGALYQAFKLLRYIGQGELFTPRSVRVLRTIKYCLAALIVLVVGAEAYIVGQRDSDDIAGGVAMGLFAILIFAVVAVSTALFERYLQKNSSTVPDSL